MRCTLLNSLERHLAPLCRGLTSLYEPAEHQTSSLIWQRLWLMIPVRSGKAVQSKKKCDLNLLIRPQRQWGCTVTSAIDTRAHPNPLRIWHLFPQPPSLLSFCEDRSIKAAFCSQGSYGASGVCHCPHPLWISTKRGKSGVLALFNRDNVFVLCAAEALFDLRGVMIDDCEANDEDDETFHCTSDTDAQVVSRVDLIFHFRFHWSS